MSKEFSFEELAQKLSKSFSKDGDFPAMAKVVNDLRRLALDYKVSTRQIADLILKEPSLGTRVLSLVNSAYFRRVKPILSVSEAVLILGSKTIADLCASLLVINTFSGKAKDSQFAKALAGSLLASMLTGALCSSENKKNEEIGFLVTVFRRLGELLLSYYFPEIANKIEDLARAKQISFEQSFFIIYQRSILELVSLVLSSINMPKYYSDFLMYIQRMSSGEKQTDLNPEFVDLARKVEFSHELMTSVLKDNEVNLEKLANKYGLDTRNIEEKLRVTLQSASALEEVTGLDFSTITEKIAENSGISVTESSQYEKNDQLLQPLKDAIKRNCSTAALLLLATDILKNSFHRVVLFLKSKEEDILKTKVFNGNFENFDIKNLVLDMNHHLIPKEKNLPNFPSKGLFKDSYPVVVVPLVAKEKLFGLLYADRVESVEGCLEINPKEKDLVTKLHRVIHTSIHFS